MPKFAAKPDPAFQRGAFHGALRRSQGGRFRGGGYLFPYAYDKNDLAQALRANGLKQVLHNLPAGNWDAGERGIACHPDRVDEFRAGVDRAIEYATALGCPQVNCLAGKLPAGVEPRGGARHLCGEPALRADKLKKAGLRLLIEPITATTSPASS